MRPGWPTVVTAGRPCLRPMRALFLITIVIFFSGMPRLTAAQAPSECSAPVQRWADQAARQTGLEVSVAHCDRDLIVLRLQTPDLVANVEVRPGGRGGFRRAGDFAVSPVIQVRDWSEVPASYRVAFDALTRFVSAVEPPQRGTESAPIETPADRAGALPPRMPPLPLLLLPLLLIVGRRRPPQNRLALAPAAGLFALASLLRFGLAPFELFRGGQGPLWIGALYGHHALAARTGYTELYGWLAHLAGAEVEFAVFTMNAILGAALAPLAYAFVTAAGAPRRAALLGGLALATEPLLITMAPSESYFVPAAFAIAAASWLLVGVNGHLDRRRVAPAAALLFAAAILLEQAARIHAAAWPGVALAPLAIAAGQEPRRGALRMALAATVLALVAAPRATDFLAMAHEAGEAVNQLEPASLSSLSWPALLGAALLIATRRKERATVLYGFATVVAVYWSARAYDNLPDVRAGFLRTGALGAVVFFVFATPRKWRDTRALSAVAIALLVSNAATAWRPATVPDTSARENAVVRSILDELPEECVLLHPSIEPMLPLYHGRRLGERARGWWLNAEPGALGASGALGCTYYFRGSFCASRQGRRACDLVERGVRLRAVESHRIATRSYDRSLPTLPAEIVLRLFEVER